MYMDMATVETGLQLRCAHTVGGCEMLVNDDDSDGGVAERKVLTRQHLILDTQQTATKIDDLQFKSDLKLGTVCVGE